MRLAANADSGFPVILSLWFLPEDDELLAAVHRDARIANRLKTDPRCAFEIAPNEPPYRGVRGRAIACLESEGAGALLERLLDRYLGSSDSSLGRFLLARAPDGLAQIKKSVFFAPKSTPPKFAAGPSVPLAWWRRIA